MQIYDFSLIIQILNKKGSQIAPIKTSIFSYRYMKDFLNPIITITGPLHYSSTTEMRWSFLSHSNSM